MESRLVHILAAHPQRQTLPVVLVLLLGACGPPVDDGYHLLNDPDEVGVRQMAVACPNGGKDVPKAPQFGPSIDKYASYVGQSKCDPTAKPGVIAFKNLVLATYPCTGSSGITRSCSVGGKSEHKEGRAWDWKINYPHPAATTFLAWLIAPDSHGNSHAMARRLGVMYMIWNRKIWKSYQASKGWQTYTGSSPHTDHVHFSFSWDGANKKSTFWTTTTPPPPPPPPPPPADSGVPPAPDSMAPGKQDSSPPPAADGTVPRADGWTGPAPDAGAQGYEEGQKPQQSNAPGSAQHTQLVGGCSLMTPAASRADGGGALALLLVGSLFLIARARRRSR